MASAPGQPQLLPTPQQPVLLPPQPPQPQPQPQQQQGKKAKKKKQAPTGLPDALTCEDLCSRFILNCPAEELASFERIMFLVEQAHWFYEDFVREKRTDLKSLSLREFATHLFTTCVSLRPYVGHLDTIYKSFTSYKVTVPVYGCIVLNSACSRALMVKGWKAGASWGFPRGKVNKDEDPAICASREVYEETGLNLETLVDPETFLEVTMAGQVSRMYIVRGCDEDAARMAPIARKEISKIEWHKVADLPTTRDAKGANGNKYWNVHPFVKPLRRYIKDLKKKGAVAGGAQQAQYYDGMDMHLPGMSDFNFPMGGVGGMPGIQAPPLVEPLAVPEGAMTLAALEGAAGVTAQASPSVRGGKQPERQQHAAADAGPASAALAGWQLDARAVMSAVDAHLAHAQAA